MHICIHRTLSIYLWILCICTSYDTVQILFLKIEISYLCRFILEIYDSYALYIPGIIFDNKSMKSEMTYLFDSNIQHNLLNNNTQFGGEIDFLPSILFLRWTNSHFAKFQTIHFREYRLTLTLR